MNSNVYSLAAAGGRVYVGGAFGSIAGQPRANVGAVDAATGAVVADFRPNTNGSVYALAASGDGSQIYLGGSFNQVAGTARASIARLTPAGRRWST